MFSKVLVIGASGGIGSALVQLLRPTCDVDTLSRKGDGFDVRDEESVAAGAKWLTGPYDLIICATGALELDGQGPEKTIRAIDPAVMQAQFAVNAVGPASVLKHFHQKLAKGPSVFAILSARVGSIEDNRLGGWISYRTAKAALNQIIRTSAIEIARKRPEAACVAIHPGTVRTSLTEKYASGHSTVSASEPAQNIMAVLSGLTADHTGRFFDWQGKQIPF